MVFLLLVIIIIIIINFFTRVFSECTEAIATSIIPLATNFPGICAFVIGFNFTVWTKKSAKKIRKQVRGCLQNLSIGSYSPEVRAFGTLIMSTKVFSLINLQNVLTTPPKRSFT